MPAGVLKGVPEGIHPPFWPSEARFISLSLHSPDGRNVRALTDEWNRSGKDEFGGRNVGILEKKESDSLGECENLPGIAAHFSRKEKPIDVRSGPLRDF